MYSKNINKKRIDHEYSGDKIFLHINRIDDFLSGKNIVPVTFEVNLTNRCNHRCWWCSEWSYRKSRLRDSIDKDAMIRCLEDMALMGVKSVTWEGGGEPTLHPNFDEIIRSSYEFGIDNGLITNGMLLEDKIDIVLNYLKYVRISIDAGTSKQHYEGHNVAGFERIIDSIKTIIDKRESGGSDVVVGVSYIISRSDPDVEIAVRLFRDIGVNYIQFKPLIVQRDSRDVFEYFDNVIEKLKLLKYEYDDLYGFRVILSRFDNKEPYRIGDFPFCYAHRFIGALTASGEVHLCCNLKHLYGSEYSFGNIHEDSFRNIWNSRKRIEMIKKTCEGDPRFIHTVCGQCRMNDFNRILNGLKKKNEHVLRNFI